MNPVRKARAVQPVEDPRGRVDILIRRLAERFTHRVINPRLNLDVWPHLQPVVEAKIQDLRIPARSVSLLEVAQRFGLVKRGLKCSQR